MDTLRENCPMRHENGNCTVIGGFCTAVNDPICEGLHNAYKSGSFDSITWKENTDLDKALLYFERMYLALGEINPLTKIAYQVAIAAINVQKELNNNAPLTVDELRQMNGERIYIRYIGACEGFYEDEYAPYFGRYEQYVHEYNGMLRGCDLPLQYYGESWLAYYHKPNERVE